MKENSGRSAPRRCGGLAARMGALRRSHLAALAAVAALLLLLLARGTPPRPPRPAPAPARGPAPGPAVPATTPGNDTAAAPPTKPPPKTPPAKPPPEASKPAPAASPKSQPAAADPSVQLTGQLYVAGHERAHPELCPALGARLAMLILVTSAPAHAAARDGVRLTWGHYAARRDVAFAFVLGSPPAALRPALEAEDALYGDLIIGNSIDSYSNLTLKTLSMLEWADTYCPRAPRLLKTDDDMFINVPRLLKFAAAPNRVNATRTIWGKVLRKAYPKRTPKSKYYLSASAWPGRVLPDFATGPAYLLTADAVAPLLAAAPQAPYLRLEDVFVTGVLAGSLGVSRTHAAEFYNRRMAPHPCAVQRGLAIHMVRYHEQFDLWRKLLDGKTKCAGT